MKINMSMLLFFSHWIISGMKKSISITYTIITLSVCRDIHKIGLMELKVYFKELYISTKVTASYLVKWLWKSVKPHHWKGFFILNLLNRECNNCDRVVTVCYLTNGAGTIPMNIWSLQLWGNLSQSFLLDKCCLTV